MFVLIDNPTFVVPAVVEVPTDHGHEEQTFSATFAVVHDDEIAGFDLSDRDQTLSFLRRVWIGFDDVFDAEKQVIVFSESSRDNLLGFPYVRLALIKAYYKGMFKAQTGN